MLAAASDRILPDAPADADREASARCASAWESTGIFDRLACLRRARHLLAGMGEELVSAISPELSRRPADTLAAELLPLLEACRFLERNAGRILRRRTLGRVGLPFWLAGVQSTVERVPLGRVLVFGPSNYPLLLPGVQVLQALAAGNTVVWKPGRGGARVASLFSLAMGKAGLPAGVLEITGDGITDGESALDAGADKVFFTGSANAGRSILRRLADSATPAVMELSGCDAVIVLPRADLHRVVQAVAFGMRLNGSATCMAPRRLLLVDQSAEDQAHLLQQLREALRKIDPVPLPPATDHLLRELLAEAERDGARVIGELQSTSMRPLLVAGVRPEMRVARTDIFAPVLSVIAVDGCDGVLRAQQACPFALTVSVFGPERAARSLAARLVTGSVLINDLIVPTADPRVSFGGRRGSGFGVTRGEEGLLEMTAVRVIQIRRGRFTRHYDATGEMHRELFNGVIGMAHSAGLRRRAAGLNQMIRAARTLVGKQ